MVSPEAGPAGRAALRSALRASADDLLGYFERRVRPVEDAADLLGETMLQAWRRCDALPVETERQRMWLFTIAANVVAYHRRSLRRRTALTERLRGQLRVPAAEPDPAEAQAVRDAVRRLPDDQRELVMLIHWDGFSVTDAAGILGVNPSTARTRYAAARAGLATALTETACDV